jgi:hypothetical protein
MFEIYKSIFKIEKEEVELILITFIYIFFRNLFLEKFVNLYFLIFLFEVYITIFVYSGIKKSVYNENFNFSEIFKDSIYYFPSILFYYLFLGFSGSIIYLIISSMINSIKTFSIFSYFLYILIISWASIPVFFLTLTLYTPFIIIAKNETIFNGMRESLEFIKKNFSNLICLFFPFLVIWFFFFLIFQKYDKINLLKTFFILLVSLIEILTVKLVFLTLKGEKNERNI